MIEGQDWLWWSLSCFPHRTRTPPLATPDRFTWHGRRDHAPLLLATQAGVQVSEITGLTSTISTWKSVRTCTAGAKASKTGDPTVKKSLMFYYLWNFEAFSDVKKCNIQHLELPQPKAKEVSSFCQIKFGKEMLNMRRTLIALTTSLLTLSGLFGIAGESSAGKNGQQLMMCVDPHSHPDFANLIFIGTNEKGWTNIQTEHLPFEQIWDNPWPGTVCARKPGWWWVGNVQVNAYNSNNQYLTFYRIDVPRVKVGSDWAGAPIP
ncbi:hypothetical protein LWC34_06260 [Kibdelosporangium philippinense]|uniref:Uncharacterized protein n=1 Tax=Kibdelosporangium philippinense TaxID=211113 RepID=A0ABS8Z3M4_9PSEU|nr:hypothetical protein [Kibdelosporangium philippinense]MCE7002435.1 hypothetical protein [Kibdelosporangium philippinense]